MEENKCFPGNLAVASLQPYIRQVELLCNSDSVERGNPASQEALLVPPLLGGWGSAEVGGDC